MLENLNRKDDEKQQLNVIKEKLKQLEEKENELTLWIEHLSSNPSLDTEDRIHELASLREQVRAELIILRKKVVVEKRVRQLNRIDIELAECRGYFLNTSSAKSQGRIAQLDRLSVQVKKELTDLQGDQKKGKTKLLSTKLK